MALYCPQRTDAAPDRLEELADDRSAEASILRRRLGIGADWATRWQSLSHGERKRAQLATALWQQPDVLAIDEPTNHLDEEARTQIEEALRSFAGVGILVSHDRALRDPLLTGHSLLGIRSCRMASAPKQTDRSARLMRTPRLSASFK